GGVDLVVLAVEQRELDADQRVARQHAVLHGVLGTGVHRRDVLLRDGPPVTLFSNSYSAPSAVSSGSIEMMTLANCPEPPVCFLCVYSYRSTLRRIVSR